MSVVVCPLFCYIFNSYLRLLDKRRSLFLLEFSATQRAGAGSSLKASAPTASMPAMVSITAT